MFKKELSDKKTYCSQRTLYRHFGCNETTLRHFEIYFKYSDQWRMSAKALQPGGFQPFPSRPVHWGHQFLQTSVLWENWLVQVLAVGIDVHRKVYRFADYHDQMDTEAITRGVIMIRQVWYLFPISVNSEIKYCVRSYTQNYWQRLSTS